MVTSSDGCRPAGRDTGRRAYGETAAIAAPVVVTASPRLASYDGDIVKNAAYAVTVEPSGGSPDGKPTLPPVFAGKLIETVPQADKR